MRVALDTNVVVGALATRGVCADLLHAVLAEHDVLVGETVLAELRTVLRRSLRVPDGMIAAPEAFLRRQAIVVAADARHRRDDDLTDADALVLAEAAAGAADVLVTGDHELLNLARPPVAVVSPRQLWERMRRAR